MRSKRILYSILTNILLQLIIIAYYFIVPKIIISKFGSNVNGLVTSITQFLAYITLLESGFGPVVKSILYKPIAKKDYKSIASILKTSEKFFHQISFFFIIYIILLVFIYPSIINTGFDKIFTASLIIIISISTFSEYYFGITYRLFLQADQKNYIVSIIQIMTYTFSIISILILSKFNISIHTLKLYSGLIFALKPLLQNYYIKNKYNINLREGENNYIIKQKWDGLAQHVAAVIHSSTDITLITIFCNLIEVSIYSVYSLIVKGIKAIIQAFTSGIDASFGDMIAKGEKNNLIIKFNTYEVLYNTINVILFTSTLVLITPFVNVYTIDIKDANYIRPLFGYLIVISEYLWAIRLPYSSIVLAAGHFKETKKGAWVECFTNIFFSTILIKKYGIIGVTIGTIFAMSIRTIEFVYHTNKYILQRNIFESLKKILLVIIETIIIFTICKRIPFYNNCNYFNWILNAIIVASISTTITLIINMIFFKKEIKQLKIIFNRLLNRIKITHLCNKEKSYEKNRLK